MPYFDDRASVRTETFTPLLHILYALEPEFGCEGAPEDGALSGSIIAEDERGRRTLPIAEETLFASRLSDDTWLGTAGGQPVLRMKTGELTPLNAAERDWWNRIS